MFSNYGKPGRPCFQTMEMLDVHVFIGRPRFLKNRPIAKRPSFTSTHYKQLDIIVIDVFIVIYAKREVWTGSIKRIAVWRGFTELTSVRDG